VSGARKGTKRESGSTGTPKGMPITHGNLSALIDALQAICPFDENDRVLQMFDLGFDLSIACYIAPLCFGACSFPVPPGPFRFSAISELLTWDGMTTDSLGKAFHMWPYFFFLAGGIGIAQLWVTWRGRRRAPWTLDRWLVTDVLAAFVTTQFYAVIHVFYYAQYVNLGTPADYWVMFLRAFGLA
jgi:hypothetical protein